MIDFNLMDLKIKSGEAKVLKVNERRSNGVYVRIVEFDGETYKLCTSCKFYHSVNNFTWIKSSECYHPKCKICRNKHALDSYYQDEEVQIRQRWHAINRSQKPKHKCTLEEFTKFFKEAKCPYTGRTLMDDFLHPSLNPNFRLEVDHIKPVKNGGTSKINNLQVLPRWMNKLKMDCSPTEFRETLEFISNVAGVYQIKNA